MQGLEKIVIRIYLLLFSGVKSQRFNNFILNLVLRARGYNNCCDGEKSGEYNLINKIFRYDIKVCLDIGANVGNYSKYLLENYDAKVISFEPLLDSFLKLKTLESDYPDRFMAFNLALSSENVEKNFYFGSSESELGSLDSSTNEIPYVGNSNLNKKRIYTQKLDTFIDSNSTNVSSIDFIKIDVEGHELEVLQGASKTLSRFNPKFIQIEHNWHHLTKAQPLYLFGKILNQYQCYQILSHKKGFLKIDLINPLNNLFMYSNYVFVHRDLVESFER